MATLAARLASLYDIGKKTIPDLADQFGSAHKQLDGVSGNGADWLRDEDLGTGKNGSFSAWAGLVNQISQFCNTTHNHLKDTGAAVVYLANDYARTDGQAETEYKKLTGQV